MKFGHTVKHNGVLYPAGTEVPVEVRETENQDACEMETESTEPAKKKSTK